MGPTEKVVGCLKWTCILCVYIYIYWNPNGAPCFGFTCKSRGCLRFRGLPAKVEVV